MERTAVIENREFHLLETVPSLNGQERFILCKDSNGSRFICPEEFWLHHVPEPKTTAPVHTSSTSREKIGFFPLPVSGAGKPVCQALL